MYRKADIIYRPSQNDMLRELLVRRNIRFKDNGDVCKFSVNADVPDDALIITEAERLNATVLYSWQFDSREIADAQWYLMESRNGKIDSADDDYTFTFSCSKGIDELGVEHYRHKRQIAPYCVRRTVKWSEKNQICGDSTGGLHTFFCSAQAKALLRQNLIGLEFDPVLYAGDKQAMTDVYQLRAVQCLPNEALVLPSETSIDVCPQCGERRILFAHSGLDYITIKKEYLQNPYDIYETEERFGWGFGYPLVIISKKMYWLLTENLREQSLSFTPIKVL